jgi:biotin---protein ligase
MLHLSSIQNTAVDELLFSWEEIMTKDEGEEYIRGENDLFHLEKRESRWGTGQQHPQALARKSESATGGAMVDFNAAVKKIVPHDESWPDAKTTPNFNHGLYYSSLKGYRKVETCAEEWGSILMYGEVVTSTNTLLDK